MQNNDFKKYATKHLGLSTTVVDNVEKHLNKTIPTTGYMTPMILEERQLNVTQLSVFDRLLLDRILWVSGNVDNNMSDIIQAQLLYLDNSEKEKDVIMHIMTPGGSTISGMGIVDVMDYISCDVATINLGMCASMGSVLLSSGTKGKRQSLINSTVMLHHVSAGSQGTVDDMRITQYEVEKTNYLLFKRLSENTGKSFEEIHDLCTRDKWLNSDEAVDFGLIDSVIGLKADKSNSISSSMNGFEEYYKKYVFNK